MAYRENKAERNAQMLEQSEREADAYELGFHQRQARKQITLGVSLLIAAGVFRSSRE